MADEESGDGDDLELVYWRAISNWSGERFEQLSRQAVHALQRIAASGIFGDDYGHKTLWDEYCHEVQDGPTLAEAAMMGTVQSVVAGLVQRLPVKESILLTLSDNRFRTTELVVDEEYLVQQVVDILCETAGERNLSRFDPSSTVDF